ncbi:hypothetical protein N9Y42_03965 [Mariniblastus sp.]|nr:hypothetical protein [Mariniblastus sp.]
MDIKRYWRWGIVLAFLLVYFSIGDSGAFLFDNAIIGSATRGWNWEWSSRIESVYEWGLMATLTAGLYFFLVLLRQDFQPQVTVRYLIVFTVVVAICALLFSIELKAYNAQRAIGEKLEREGGCILFKHYSIIFSGRWYQRFAIAIVLPCSIYAGAFWVCKIFRFGFGQVGETESVG